MAARTMRELERVRYWQGQLLAAQDLQAQIASDAQLRALHNRALHRTFGIAAGLQASIVIEKVARDGAVTERRKLNVACGIAYDCDGHMLLLQHTCTLDLPAPAAEPQILVFSHDKTSTGGGVLTWMPVRDYKPSLGVGIARLAPNATEIHVAFPRVIARPLARPRLATGTTISGETPWKSWKIDNAEVGVEVTIDTSATGFTRMPHYFADAVIGTYPKEATDISRSDDEETPRDNGVNPQRDTVDKNAPELAWFASIAEPSTTSFKLQLLTRGVMRQALRTEDPKVRIVDKPKPALPLSDPDKFVLDDLAARLLPLSDTFVKIEKLTGTTVTLETLLPLGDQRAAAFGNLPRTTTVVEFSEPSAFYEVEVDTPEAFAEGDVIVKLGSGLGSNAAVIAAIDEATLELSTPIAGLAIGDKLGVAQPAGKVLSISILDITVDAPEKFLKGDVVARLGHGAETAVPAIIADKKTDGTLTLSAAITDLKVGSTLGIAKSNGEVLDITANAIKQRIQVKDVTPFRAGDLVAKVEGGVAGRPVRVERRDLRKNILRLEGTISGLAPDDTIVAANFPVRGTVTAVSGNVLTVANATAFPARAYLALITDLLAAGPPVAVSNSLNDKLTLADAIPDLKPYDVIGLCSFPPTVKVRAVDKTTVVLESRAIQNGDIVAARGYLAMVTAANGAQIELAKPIPGLSTGDSLSVATISGTIAVSSLAGVSVRAEQPSRLRPGDFLALIVGWRQATAGKLGSSQVKAANGDKIALAELYGLLKNDTIGFVSATADKMQLRLRDMPDLRTGDRVQVIGFDRLKNRTLTFVAVVSIVPQSLNTVMLTPVDDKLEFTFRPEDMSAATMLIRGSILGLIQKYGLYVSWFACGEPDPYPRSCKDGVRSHADPCATEGATIA